jgi:glycosyltransferase involved in cell wall biosynthesis
MKILMYARDWAPSVGGVETITMILARGLSARKVNHPGEEVAVTLVTQTPASGMNDSALPFRVVRCPGFLQLARLIHEADLLHMAGPSLLPSAIAWLIGKPAVIEHHGFQSICPNGQLLYEPTETPCSGHFMARRYRECIRCNFKVGRRTSVKMWLLTFPRRWLAQRVSANIVPTSWLGSQLQLNRMRTIGHGLPPRENPPERRNTTTIPTFVFLGRLVSAKGVRVLVEATALLKAKHREFQVRIIGAGPERQRLEKLVQDLDVQNHVRFEGYLPAERLEEDLRDVAIVVMPSLGGEVFGLVAVENMQQARLVIASDIGALSEVLGDAGMTFTTGNAQSLANCMEMIINEPSLADGIGQEAVQRVAREFAADQMIGKHAQVYQEICRIE